jgi:predicted protein tyrosine phosphatase
MAEEVPPAKGVGMISITDPGTPKARLQSGWKPLLRLRFHDISRPWPGYVIMDEKHGNALLRWLSKHEDNLLSIVVHCEAGISRSTAVAKFICERHGLPVNEKEIRLYNQHVYGLLCDLDHDQHA